MHAWSRSMHITVSAFRIYAQRGEVVAKRGGWKPCKIMEITLLVMEKSWNCVFIFLWEPCVNKREKLCLPENYVQYKLCTWINIVKGCL